MSSAASSYIIVGAGVFGASTALQLSKEKPAPKIVLFDRDPYPCPIAASHDINKIVRSDYGDIFYCKLGLKTLQRWRTDPLFSKWYHQSGLLKATDHSADLVQKIFNNYKELNVDVGAELIEPGEIRNRFKGLFLHANLSEIGQLLWTPTSGWADAAEALKDTIKAAIDNGVHYVAASVERLLLNDGSCSGVVTDDGRTFTADKIILSTGAYTAKILADSAPHRPELGVADRIAAYCVCEAAVDLTKDQRQKFEHGPAVVIDANITQGETMPPTLSNQLKFIRDIPFINTVHHSPSGQSFSVPFTNQSRSQWISKADMPSKIVSEIDLVVQGIYGSSSNLDPSHYRLCWDGVTRDSNWYITPHSRCRNLFVATGGSFHGWKFLPILGEYVVAMLKGELDEEERKRWEWDRDLDGYSRFGWMPTRELRDAE